MVEMGIGGILGVNAGSAEPPRLIKLTYSPDQSTGRLAMVGKGIMYDSGGLALKPGDAVHAADEERHVGRGGNPRRRRPRSPRPAPRPRSRAI